MYLHFSSWCGEPTDYRSPKKLVFINETRRDFSFLEYSSLSLFGVDFLRDRESTTVLILIFFFASVGREEPLSVLLSPFHGMHVYIVYCAESDEV